jgi:hypothetical protein
VSQVHRKNGYPPVPAWRAASNVPMPLVFLPLLGSGFVAVESMPAGLRWFAEHQPFTPIMSPRSWTPSVYC